MCQVLLLNISFILVALRSAKVYRSKLCSIYLFFDVCVSASLDLSFDTDSRGLNDAGLIGAA